MNNLSAQSIGLSYPARMQFSVGEPKTKQYRTARKLADAVITQMKSLTPAGRELILCRILRKFPGTPKIGEIGLPVDRKGKHGFSTGGGYTYDHIFSYK